MWWRWARRIGEAGERAAERDLRRRGYVILDRNFRCPRGEIDLVALDRGEVVFVEVKTRGTAGEALDAVDLRKRRDLVRAARVWAARNRIRDHRMRFDVVTVVHRDGRFTCELLRDAFAADDVSGGPRRRAPR